MKTEVTILALDPKETHGEYSGCPSRLVRAPNGHWMCIDCGLQVVEKLVRCTVREDQREVCPVCGDREVLDDSYGNEEPCPECSCD